MSHELYMVNKTIHKMYIIGVNKYFDGVSFSNNKMFTLFNPNLSNC